MSEITFLFIDRQIKLLEMELERLDTSTISGHYGVKINKAMVGHLKHKKAQGKVHIRQDDLDGIRRYWHRQIMD